MAHMPKRIRVWKAELWTADKPAGWHRIPEHVAFVAYNDGPLGAQNAINATVAGFRATVPSTHSVFAEIGGGWARACA